MNHKSLFLLSYIIYFTTTVLAQQQEVEPFLEQQKDFSDISDLIELLDELEKNPIDLNQATVEQLTVLPWISDVLAVVIIDYRNQIGGFENIEELTRIKNMNPEMIQILKKYLTVSSKKFEKKISFSTKTRISRKLEKCEGLRNGIYYPSPNKVYNRFMLNYRNYLRFGILTEKDCGETKIDDLKLYFLNYQNKLKGNKLIFGNYRLEFAQGLLFGNPYGYYKSNAPIYPAKRRGRELLEYTLVDENASLYGVAGKFCFKIYQFIFFLSSAKIDATINLDGTVRNFYRSGYHRNFLELNKKDQLREQLVGTRLCIKPAPYFTLGMTYYQSLFDRNGALKNENEYQFSFNRINELVGIDYNLALSQFSLFGEAARSKNNGFGILVGVLTNTKPLEVVILARKYSKNLISLHGNSFGECSYYPRNEQGVYFGFQFNPLKNLKFALYFDQFKFPWCTYFIPMPSGGTDFFLRAEHKPLKNLVLYLQFKFSQKDKFKTEQKIIIPRSQKIIRFQLEYIIWNTVRIRHRTEKIWGIYTYYKQLPHYNNDRFEGALLYQDLVLHLKNNFNIAARITFFDTDGYESRLYQFEHDVPGMLTNKMLYGTGNRWYIMLQWKFKSVIKLSMKISSTQYHHVNSIGTDADMILGNTLNSINLQLETNW